MTGNSPATQDTSTVRVRVRTSRGILRSYLIIRPVIHPNVDVFLAYIERIPTITVFVFIFVGWIGKIIQVQKNIWNKKQPPGICFGTYASDEDVGVFPVVSNFGRLRFNGPDS